MHIIFAISTFALATFYCGLVMGSPNTVVFTPEKLRLMCGGFWVESDS